MQTLPDFLIAGAMKAGTTTLYRDLLANPAIFFPEDKEVNALADPQVTTAAGRKCYQWYYRTAQPHQLRGDASTSYTKRPCYEGVTQRAAAVLPGSTKVIYLVREPVSRIVSHYLHERAAGRIRCAIDEAVHQHPPLLDYTRYAWQIEPWMEAFGAEQIRIVVFEEYVANRQAVVQSLCEFLGVKHHPPSIDDAAVYNRSKGKPLERGAFFALSQHPLYRRYIRPLLAPGVRDRLRRTMMPRDHALRPTPLPGTAAFIRQQLRDDHQKLCRLMQRTTSLWPGCEDPSRQRAG